MELQKPNFRSDVVCRERESYSINGPRERERGGTSPERFRLLSTLHHQLLPFSFSRHRKRRRAHYLRWRPTPHRFHRPAHLIMHNRVGYNPATKCNRLVLLLRTHTAYIRKRRREKKKRKQAYIRLSNLHRKKWIYRIFYMGPSYVKNCPFFRVVGRERMKQ